MTNPLPNNRKIRVLALCDSPPSATGFAQVARNILKGLADTGKYDIDVIGINYFGDYYDRDKHPYKLFPAQGGGANRDMHGRIRFLSAINGNEEKFGLLPPWDIFFTIQDPFVIEGLGIGSPWAEQIVISRELWRRELDTSTWFKWIGYFPVDSDLKENWVTKSIALPDYPVAYCDWGKSKIMEFNRPTFETKFNIAADEKNVKRMARIPTPTLDGRISVIHHGVDTKVFHPISAEEKAKFRKEYFKDQINDNTYLVVNVSRNQPRKDLARTLKVFAAFHQQVPNSHLYLHCRDQDVGGNVHEMARNFKLSPGKDYTVPGDFHEGTGYPIEVVNKIYNAADLCMTTTLGEGWGFITTEAMATKTPIVAPNITSILDIFGSYEFTNDVDQLPLLENSTTVRGIPVKAGTTTSEWVSFGLEDNERVRPLTNVADMVEKMLWAYHRPDKVKEITERAYLWAQQQSWENIVAQWDKLFTEAYTVLQDQRLLGDKLDKTGRNDPCPCGSGLKFKRCHGSADRVQRISDWLIKPEAPPPTP